MKQGSPIISHVSRAMSLFIDLKLVTGFMFHDNPALNASALLFDLKVLFFFTLH